MIYTLRRIIKEHIMEHSVQYFFLLLSLLTGIVAGALFVGALPKEKSNELMGIINNFCKSATNNELMAFEIFKTSAINNIRTVGLLCLCATSIVFVPIIYLFMVARGFVIGFTVGFMSLFFGFKGFALVSVSVLPQSIISLTAIMLMSIISLNYAVKKRKPHKNSFVKLDDRHELILFTYSTLIIFAILIIGAAIDAFVVPVFVKAISGLYV